MSIDIAHFTRILDKFQGLDYKYRLEVVSDSLWRVGVTRNKDASFFDNDWMLFEITNGGPYTAGNDSGDTFEKNWNDRATYAYSMLSDIMIDSFTISESGGVGSLVGNITSSGGRLPIAYSLFEDLDEKFSITGTELKLAAAVTYPNTHEIKIKATDADNKTLIKTIEIVILEAVNTHSLSFNGIDEGANDEAGSVDEDLGGANFSAVARIKVNTTSTRGVIVNKWQSGKNSFMFNVDANKLEVWVSQDGSTFESVGTTTVLNTVDWHNVGFTFAPNEVKIYIAGLVIKTQAVSRASIFKSDAQVNVGYYTAVAWSFDGLINEVLMYNKTLSDAEMLAIENGGDYLSPTHPLAPSGLRGRHNAGNSYHLDGSDYKFNEEVNAKKLICFGMDSSNKVEDAP